LKPSNFQDKLHNIQTAKGTDRALLISPRLMKMPLPMQRFDDPFLPFGRAIISATQDFVCAYIFDLAAYLAIGAAGAVALERTIASVDEMTITILHGPFVGSGYIEVAEAFSVDGLTLAHEDDAADYQIAGFGILIVSEKFIDGLLPVDGTTDGNKTLRLTVFGENALYAGLGEDFAERVRAALLL
jgi:hypothetical protein